MTTAVRLSEELVRDARSRGKRLFRTAPKQIEYWCRLAKAAEDNPDLPVSFLKNTLDALDRSEKGEKEPVELRFDR